MVSPFLRVERGIKGVSTELSTKSSYTTLKNRLLPHFFPYNLLLYKQYHPSSWIVSMRTGISNLPLHGGKAPRWLFSRMTKLAREITIWIVREYGPEDVIRRLADPHWFQAFGCVLGFDWHSSGVTTTVCGAMKEGISGLEADLGLFLAGGKGARSRKTPAELEAFGPHLTVDPAGLVYASRMSAKVDNTALQDGYQLYHHLFMTTP